MAEKERDCWLVYEVLRRLSIISSHSKDLAFFKQSNDTPRYQEPRAKSSKGIGSEPTKACFVDSYRIAILSFVKRSTQLI